MKGQLDQARTLQEELVLAYDRLGGPGTPEMLSAQAELAVMLLQQGDGGKAKQLQERVIAASQRSLGPEHPQTLQIQVGRRRSFPVLAKTLLRFKPSKKCCRGWNRVWAPIIRQLCLPKSALALALWAIGDLQQASRFQREVLAARESVSGPEHPQTLLDKSSLGLLLSGPGRPVLS